MNTYRFESPQTEQVDQRLPAVGPVLLPERGVGLVAADVSGGPLHHRGAVAEGAGGAARYALGIGVEVDADQRAPRPGGGAQLVEEG